jgi:hypothetical protein
MKAQSVKFTVDLPADANEKDMLHLAAMLEPIVGAKVQLVKKMIFEVENLRAAEVIQVVVDADLQGYGKKTAKTKKDDGRQTTDDKGMGRASYRRIANGEILSTRVLNQLIANYEFPDDTRFENCKGETFTLITMDGKQKLIKEPQI